MENKSKHNDYINKIEDITDRSIHALQVACFFIIKCFVIAYGVMGFTIWGTITFFRFIFILAVFITICVFGHIILLYSNDTYAYIFGNHGADNPHTEQEMIAAIYKTKNQSEFWKNHSTITIKRLSSFSKEDIRGTLFQVDSIEDQDCFINPFSPEPFGPVSNCYEGKSKTRFIVFVRSKKDKLGWYLKVIDDRFRTSYNSARERG